MSEETIEKLRAAGTGRKMSPEHKAKFVEAGAMSRTGKPISEERIKKMRQGHKAYFERIKNGK